MTQLKSKELKRLQKIWYKKLEKEGFEDIEQSDGLLKTWHGSKWNRGSDGSKFSAPYKEEYYRLAGYFLHEHKFENETTKEIWRLHTEGVSIRKITKTLNKAKNKRNYEKCINTKNINKTLKELSKQMMDLYRSESPKVSLKEIL